MVVHCCFDFENEFDSWLKTVFDAALQNICKIDHSEMPHCNCVFFIFFCDQQTFGNVSNCENVVTGGTNKFVRYGNIDRFMLAGAIHNNVHVKIVQHIHNHGDDPQVSEQNRYFRLFYLSLHR